MLLLALLHFPSEMWWVHARVRLRPLTMHACVCGAPSERLPLHKCPVCDERLYMHVFLLTWKWDYVRECGNHHHRMQVSRCIKNNLDNVFFWVTVYNGRVGFFHRYINVGRCGWSPIHQYRYCTCVGTNHWWQMECRKRGLCASLFVVVHIYCKWNWRLIHWCSLAEDEFVTLIYLSRK